MLAYGLLAFLGGVAVASMSPNMVFLFWTSIAVLGFAAPFMPRRSVFLLAILLGSFLFGGLRFQSADTTSPLEHEVGEQVELRGYVDGDFSTTSGGGAFYFEATNINGREVRERVLIRTERWPTYSLGTPLAVRGVLELPWEGDEFDYRAYLKKDGVHVLLQRPDIAATPSADVALLTFVGMEARMKLTILRDLMRSGIRTAVPEPASAYLNGIILGVREDLPDDIADAFSRTGTTHVLAISGYNIAIVAQGLLLVFLRVTGRRRAVWFAVAGIAAFAVLTGASASVVRAAIMGSLILFTQAWGRTVRPSHLVLVAAAGMVVVNPFLLRYDIGFQLSFAAVLGLVYLVPWIERMWPEPGTWDGVWQMTIATGAANIATLPLILVHFGAFPVYSLPANLLILPFIPYAMAWGAAAGAVALVSRPAAVIMGTPAWALATWQLAVVKWFDRLPWSSVSVRLSWGLALTAYSMLIFVYLRYGNRRSDHSAP